MERVVLFDFDGVLIRGDSFARLLRSLIERSPWRRATALATLPIMFPLLVSPWKKPAVRGYLWLATAGQDDAGLEAAIAAELERAATRWIQASWDALAAHRTAGDRVIVVTGAGDVLARRLLAERGHGDVELLASPVTRAGRGAWTARRHCYGPEKVRMLAEIGVEPPWDVAYSDSAADIPMLAGAKRAVLVSPKPRAETAVVKALPTVEVVRW